MTSYFDILNHFRINTTMIVRHILGERVALVASFSFKSDAGVREVYLASHASNLV